MNIKLDNQINLFYIKFSIIFIFIKISIIDTNIVKFNYVT